jgi:hypothetical protein
MSVPKVFFGVPKFFTAFSLQYPCHPERSEGPMYLLAPPEFIVRRCAQNDCWNLGLALLEPVPSGRETPIFSAEPQPFSLSPDKDYDTDKTRSDIRDLPQTFPLQSR